MKTFIKIEEGKRQMINLLKATSIYYQEYNIDDGNQTGVFEHRVVIQIDGSKNYYKNFKTKKEAEVYYDTLESKLLMVETLTKMVL